MFDKKELEYQTPSVEELKMTSLVKGEGGAHDMQSGGEEDIDPTED